MKKLAKLFSTLALCSLIAVPAVTAYAEESIPPESAVVMEAEMPEGTDLPDMITIEEEEVPLSALPLSFMESGSTGMSSRSFTVAGLVLMGISAMGMAFVTYRRGKETI